MTAGWEVNSAGNADGQTNMAAGYVVNSVGNADGEMNMAAESEMRTCGSRGYVGHVCFPSWLLFL